jgi:hypothetical protein
VVSRWYASSGALGAGVEDEHAAALVVADEIDVHRP